MPALQSLIAASAIILTLAAGKADELTPAQQAFRQIYQELIEINTTDSVGDTVKAAEAMAARLRAAGITDVQVISTAPRKGNLVARLPGTGARRPILLTAHIDVVEAKREDWDTDPFKLAGKGRRVPGTRRNRRQGHGGRVCRQSHSIQAGRLIARTATSSWR